MKAMIFLNKVVINWKFHKFGDFIQLICSVSLNKRNKRIIATEAKNLNKKCAQFTMKNTPLYETYLLYLIKIVHSNNA